jgi:mono/diheme cytochrome c family protein/putative copper export protein
LSVLLVARAVGLLSASVILGSLAVSALAGPSDEPLARAWRRRLAKISGLLAVLLGASAVVLVTGGRAADAGPATVLHVVATGLWPGMLLSLVLLLRVASPGAGVITSGFAGRAARRATALALVPLGIATAGALAFGWMVPGGPPALIGTRYGRLLLLQSFLLTLALVLVVSTAISLRRRRHEAAGGAVVRSRLRAVALAITLGGPSIIVAAALIARPAGAPEPLIWPFPYRLAPGVMWEFPGARDQVIIGAEILVGGLLALTAACRIKGWRPLLITAGIVLSGLGAYKALAAMSLEAYPTTYARPAIADTPESIRRGHDLFLTHCAVCHGTNGRGDGPAAAGLLQRPADLTASHTADHTPGDIFWWVTHGLGLAMPGFGDQLSVEDRWDLVNFVRTLARPLPSRQAARILGPGT